MNVYAARVLIFCRALPLARVERQVNVPHEIPQRRGRRVSFDLLDDLGDRLACSRLRHLAAMAEHLALLGASLAPETDPPTALFSDAPAHAYFRSVVRA